MANRGRERKVEYDKVVEYATSNPQLLQREVAAHFGIPQCRVSYILRASGVAGINRGRKPEKKAGQSTEEHEWEQVLHSYGLGVDRGMRLGTFRILYGYDPLREDAEDESVTSTSLPNPCVRD